MEKLSIKMSSRVGESTLDVGELTLDVGETTAIHDHPHEYPQLMCHASLYIRAPRIRSVFQLKESSPVAFPALWLTWIQVKLNRRAPLTNMWSLEKSLLTSSWRCFLRRRKMFQYSLHCKYLKNFFLHLASRASFFVFLINRGGEKETLPESRQTFKVAKAPTSGLVNPVFPESCFSSASIRLLILMIITDVITGVNETEYFSLFKGFISQLRRSWYAGTSVLA